MFLLILLVISSWAICNSAVQTDWSGVSGIDAGDLHNDGYPDVLLTTQSGSFGYLKCFRSIDEGFTWQSIYFFGG